MPRIFISYRRDDSAYVAAMLHERLTRQFGSDRVFFDIDNIPLGVDFREHLGDAVGQCDVLLAVIGDEWLQIPKDGTVRRIDDPTDFVRIELEAALNRNVAVIPILVGRAKMPAETDLPASIRELAYRNGTEIRAGHDLQQHIERLVRALESTSNANLDSVEADRQSTGRIRERKAKGLAWEGIFVALAVATVAVLPAAITDGDNDAYFVGVMAWGLGSPIAIAGTLWFGRSRTRGKAVTMTIVTLILGFAGTIAITMYLDSHEEFLFQIALLIGVLSLLALIWTCWLVSVRRAR